MALTNIEYGSIASSEIMNNNFSYLDNKISETNEALLTRISSILSNIATINSRLGELSELTEDSLDTMDSKIESYKTKTKLLVAKSAMVPNWASCTEAGFSSGTPYTAISNGYLLVIPAVNTSGNITINDVSVKCKIISSLYDHGAQLIQIPVKNGDVVSCNFTVNSAYFLPVAEVSIEGF